VLELSSATERTVSGASVCPEETSLSLRLRANRSNPFARATELTVGADGGLDAELRADIRDDTFSNTGGRTGVGSVRGDRLLVASLGEDDPQCSLAVRPAPAVGEIPADSPDDDGACTDDGKRHIWVSNASASPPTSPTT
jgi:hypothetical protein